MAAVGKPEENGYAERLMRTIREEEISLTEYADFADARGQLGELLDAVYNCKRIHSALDYLTPAVRAAVAGGTVRLPDQTRNPSSTGLTSGAHWTRPTSSRTSPMLSRLLQPSPTDTSS